MTRPKKERFQFGGGVCGPPIGPQSSEPSISPKAETFAAGEIAEDMYGYVLNALNSTDEQKCRRTARNVIQALVESGELVPASEVKARDARLAQDEDARIAEALAELRAERDRVQVSLDVAQAINREAGAAMVRLDRERLSALLDAVAEHRMRQALRRRAPDHALYAKAEEIRRGET